MKIKFYSLANHSTQENQIDPIITQFEVESTYENFYNEEHDLEYETYIFKEPNNGVANCIEVNPERINIYAGPTTLSIAKDQGFDNSYVNVDGSKMILIAQLLKVEKRENSNYFEYNLSTANNQFIGNFKIEISHLD
ncbi:hypothetical protein [Mycoplasmopsis iners]|uniref:hypothetical protein n=1 Tax=Mycoplasmopsis iners TaxID=76630 RepID=UPI0004969B2B|nr:hypothetical protein [Mycoplasmopsis iners]